MDTSQSETWQGRMLGRYRLVRLLGKGGMGEVWQAEDTELRRQVAVKLLPIVSMSERSYLQDFEREARAAASLEHPHILPVHDFGEQQLAGDEVVTYLVIPYISGGTLRDRILGVKGPLPLEEGLRYLHHAAEAIDYAHSQQVLHRDIKPANMLLQHNWLFLADFGIAKLLNSTTRHAQTYSGSGTPEYMAPEQAQGKAVFASDRYSFAVTAYQVLTGHVPFQSDTPYGILLKQITEEPPTPRLFNPQLSLAVEQVILQGLAKKPEDRPPSCIALLRALETALRTHSLPADFEATLPPSWSLQDAPPSVSSPPHSGASSTPSQQIPAPQTPVLHTPHTPHTPQLAPNVAENWATANAETRDNPQDAPTFRLHETNRSYPVQSVSSRGEESPQEAARYKSKKMTRRAVVIGGGTAALALVAGTAAFYTWSHGQSLPTTTTSGVTRPRVTGGPEKLVPGTPVLSITGHSKDVTVVKWDPTGRYLATGSDDAFIKLWDVGVLLQKSSTTVQVLSTPQKSWQLSSAILANRMCWSSDGRTLAALTGGNKIFLYDAFGSNMQPHIYQDVGAANGANPPVYSSIAWSSTATTFALPRYASGQTQQFVDIWQMNQTSGAIRTLAAAATGIPRTGIIDEYHPFNTSVNVDAVSWSVDGTRVAGHTNFGSVIVWQALTGAVKQVFNLPVRPVKESTTYVLNECVAWSPTNVGLLAASNLDVVVLCDVQKNKQVFTLKIPDAAPFLTGLSWSPNGKYLAAGYAGSPRIYVWDIEKLGTSASNTPQSTLFFFPQPGSHGHTAALTDIAWSPDGRYIASASGDTTVIVWKVDAS